MNKSQHYSDTVVRQFAIMTVVWGIVGMLVGVLIAAQLIWPALVIGGSDIVDIIFVLIPLGLVLLIAAVWAFFWAIKSGQFDDLDSPAWRILLDDDRKPPDAEQDR